MAKITNEQITGGQNPFKQLSEGAQVSLDLINALEKQIKEISKELIKVAQQKPFKSFEQFQKQQQAVQGLGKATRQLDAIEKERLSLMDKLSKANSDRVQKNIELKIQLQEQNKINRRLAQEKLGLISVYQKESARLSELRKKYKEVALTEGETSRQARALLSDISKLDARLKRIDGNVGQFQRNVGNYGNALQGLRRTFLSVASAAGVTFGAFGAFRLASGVVGIFRDFDQASSNLEAVLGATESEMNALRAEAQLLGSTTAFTASEVLALETSFAKLGFPTKDILEMTESTLNAAAAMGSDLDATASLTGATLKAFGLDASEAQRVNDVLAASTAKSALDFEKLSTSMSTIAPVAKSFGFSVEETTALLGTLSNAGFDASTAATATRNILLNLADANGDLAKSLDEPVKDLPSLVKGLKQLQSEGIDLAEALELTDRRSVAAFNTFLEGAGSLESLNTELLGAAGTAERMAAIQLDNLAGDVTILNSAWEGLILSIENGEGAFGSFLRSIVQGVTRIIGSISEVDFDEVSQSIFETAQESRKLANEAQNLLDEYESLRQDGIEPTAEAKDELDLITLKLKDRFGESVIEINKETGALELNTEAVREQIKIKRLAADEEAATLASRLKGVQEALKENEREMDSINRIVDLRRKEAKETGALQKQKEANARATGVIGQINLQLNEEQQEALDQLNKATTTRAGIIQEGNDLRSSEADLLEKLNKLNFDAADIELLFSDAKSEGNEQDKEGVDLTKLTIAELNELKKTRTDLIDAIDAELARRKKLNDKLKDNKTEYQKLQTEVSGLNQKLLEQALLGSINIDTLEEYRQKVRQLTEAQEKLKNSIDDLNTEITPIRPEDIIDGEDIKKSTDVVLQQVDLIGRKTDEELAEEQKRAEQRKAIAIATTESIGQIQSQAIENRIGKLDQEINATTTRQQQLLEKANQGVLDAQESLAAEQAKQSRLELARKREEQKQENLSAFLALLKAGIEAGKTPAEAFSNAGVILSAAPAFINALPGLYEGTDGKTVAQTLGKPHLNTQHDQYLTRVDGEEIILKGDHAAMIPKGMSGADIAMGAAHYASIKRSLPKRKDRELINKVEMLTKTIREKPVYMGSDYDIINQMINEKIKENNKIINKQTKIRRLG